MDQISRAVRAAAIRRPGLSLLLTIMLFSSCAAAPFLIPAAIEFARNLLVTSNKNYGGKYSEDMNRLMMRLSTPYVAMGLPLGTPQTALIPPTMLQQQQQAMMNQQQAMMNQQMGQAPGQMPGQFGQGMPGQPGMGMPGQPMDPYAMGQVGMPGVPFGQQPGAGYGMQGSQFGYQGQPGYYDPNNPYMPPGTNVQAPVYGMQQFGNPYGGQFGGSYGQMGGFPQQPGYPPQGMPLQPGYPSAAPGTQQPMPGMPMQQVPMYQQPMDPYQQQGWQGTQQFQQPLMQGYPQQGMQPYQQPMPGYPQQGMQPYQQPIMPNYQQPVGVPPYGYPGQMPNYPGQMPSYPGQMYPRSVAPPQEPVALDIALVRQHTTPSGGKEIVLLQDGDNLKGGSNGDRFKVVVRTNCECFVYVISIDGSGWAQPIFPVPNGAVANPLKPETEQAFPEGQYWFTLDEYKGVETFFFVASPARRTDIEESMTQLSGQQRPSGRVAAKVEEPAVIPNGFGKTQPAKATTVRDDSQQQTTVTPLSYVAAKPGEDVRVTRWFNHQ